MGLPFTKLPTATNSDPVEPRRSWIILRFPFSPIVPVLSLTVSWPGHPGTTPEVKASFFAAMMRASSYQARFLGAVLLFQFSGPMAVAEDVVYVTDLSIYTYLVSPDRVDDTHAGQILTFDRHPAPPAQYPRILLYRHTAVTVRRV